MIELYLNLRFYSIAWFILDGLHNHGVSIFISDTPKTEVLLNC